MLSLLQVASDHTMEFVTYIIIYYIIIYIAGAVVAQYLATDSSFAERRFRNCNLNLI